MTDSQSSLVEAHRAFARTIAGDYVGTLGDDAISIAYFALVVAAIEYRDGTGGFAAYARRGIRMALWNAYKATGRTSYARPAPDTLIGAIEARPGSRWERVEDAAVAIASRLDPRELAEIRAGRNTAERRAALLRAREVARELGIEGDVCD